MKLEKLCAYMETQAGCAYYNLTSDRAPPNGVSWKGLDSPAMNLSYNLDPKFEA